MKFYKKTIILIVTCILISKVNLATSRQIEEPNSLIDQNNEQLSLYIGYLMWESLQEKDFQYNLDHVIQGLKSAEKGEFIDQCKEKYQDLLIENEKQLFDKKCKRNLTQAIDFLNKIKTEINIKEIEKDKLYFKKIVSGTGMPINENDSGLFHIKCYTLTDEIITNTYTHGKPVVQDLKNAIQGFKRGTNGMLEGEKRILYIHPDLGYEIFRNFQPNTLLITEVELIKIVKQ